MEPADLKGRLAALPGVISATVGEETVALLLRADADPRLLKARAQAICAEKGETRPLVVLGGRTAAGALAGSGGTISGSWGRRTTPVTMALASLFVLSAVVLAPGDSNPSSPLSRRPPSASAALAPPGPAPAHELEAFPAVSAPPATRTGSPVPSFVRGLAPVPSSLRSLAVGAGPVPVRLETAGSSASGSLAGPAPGFGPPTFGPQLASAGPSTSRPAGSDKATTPDGPKQPTAKAGSRETATPPGPVADGPAPGIRTSSREVLASSSDDPAFSASAAGDHRVHRKSADRDRRSSTNRLVAWRATELPSKAETADKADPAPKSASAGGAGEDGNAGKDGNSEDRGAKADRTGTWGETGNGGRTGQGGRSA